MNKKTMQSTENISAVEGAAAIQTVKAMKYLEEKGVLYSGLDADEVRGLEALTRRLSNEESFKHKINASDTEEKDFLNNMATIFYEMEKNKFYGFI